MSLGSRVGIITQARMGSSRLPGKILLTVNNKALLEYQLERLEWSTIPVIVATTLQDQDEAVVAFCAERCIPYFRGSEHNVLSRFYEAALINNLDVVVRVTSDCPLVDGNMIQEGVDYYLSQNNPLLYFSNTHERRFPRGFDYEIFSFALLEETYLNATSDYDKEHVTPYIWHNRSGKVVIEHHKRTEDDSHFRITVDTPEDFSLIKTLIEDFRADMLSAEEIIRILRQHPHLNKINQHIQQKPS